MAVDVLKAAGEPWRAGVAKRAQKTNETPPIKKTVFDEPEEEE